jgi:hypothetical protein|tara:strand:- start:122 stop:346 length:225 start_codon:yes stop_codon:yes gene_type:complete
MKKEKIGTFTLEVGEKHETVTNPFSGASCELSPQAVAVYDLIKGSEMLNEYDTMAKALSLFSKKWPKEYFILLD